MSVSISVKTTDAVRLFQQVYSLANNKIAESSQIETRAFWVDYLTTSTEEISKAHGLTTEALVSQWEAWVADVDAARAKVGA